MSQNPIGTVADEQRLVELRKDSEGTFSVPVTGPLRETVDLGSEVDWRALEGGDVPRLLVGRIDPEDRSDARSPRTPTVEDGDGSDLFLEVPTPLVGEAGLGLDPEAYDAVDPLLFAPATAGDVATSPGDRTPAAVMDEAVVLEPVRFADGSPYRREPVSEASEESDPVAEAHLEARGDESSPRSETVSAPIDATVIEEVVEGVVEGTDVEYDALVNALEAIAREDLIDLADALLEYGPFTVDDRVVGIVDSDWWESEIAPALDVDEATIEAAKRAHDRQAETLLRDAGPDDYHQADEPFDAIVAARPTTPATE